jgi:hypothetical protein
MTFIKSLSRQVCLFTLITCQSTNFKGKYYTPGIYVQIRIYKTTIFPVMLYGYETLSPTLKTNMTEGVWEQGAQEVIWTEEVWNNRRLEKTA